MELRPEKNILVSGKLCEIQMDLKDKLSHSLHLMVLDTACPCFLAAGQ